MVSLVSAQEPMELEQKPLRLACQDSGPCCTKINNSDTVITLNTDRKFIDSDYESLEPHIFAHISGDEGLRN